MRISSNGIRKLAPSEKPTSSTRDWPCTVIDCGVGAPTFKPAIRDSCSYEHAFDAAVVGRSDVLGHPVCAQDEIGHLDHDVVGFEQAVVQVVAVAAQALQAARAAGQNLDVAFR